jgi:protein-tyrosine phosphatase
MALSGQSIFSNNADEILPGLWLGNFQASQDEVFLRTHGIKTVFNCTKNLQFHPSIPTRYRLPVDDNLQEDEIRNMELWSYEVIYKLLKEYKEDKPILVHCAAGMQRSAAVTAMFLMVTKGMNWEQAHRHIKQRRAIAFFPSANFEKAIVGFYNSYQRDIRPQLEPVSL